MQRTVLQISKILKKVLDLRRRLAIYVGSTPRCAASVEFDQARVRDSQTSSFRDFAQAIFVLAVLCPKGSWKALAISSDGPDSMISRSGNPWLNNCPRLRGLAPDALLEPFPFFAQARVEGPMNNEVGVSSLPLHSALGALLSGKQRHLRAGDFHADLGRGRREVSGARLRLDG